MNEQTVLCEQVILCDKGCSPALVDIGKGGKTLRWRYYPYGQGEIKDVTGLLPPTFQNGRPDGSDYLWDYTGDPTPNRSWPYQINPPCADAAEAQLTNGPT